MPKIVDREQYRKELLWKCFDLFAQKGYSAIAMREIAKGIGVSTGTLYHYFPSKEALFLQLVEEQTQEDILSFLAEAGSPETLPEKVKALMDFVAKYEEYFIKQLLLWFDFYQQQERTELLNNQTLKKAWEQSKQLLSHYLQIEDEVTTIFVCNMLHGFIVGRMFEGETVSYGEQGELLTKMLMSLGEGVKE